MEGDDGMRGNGQVDRLRWPFGSCADKCPVFSARAAAARLEPVGRHCPVGQD